MSLYKRCSRDATLPDGTPNQLYCPTSPIGSMTIRAAYIGVGGIIIAALITLLGPRLLTSFDDSSLELVDISIEETKENQCKLDVKLRNTGQRAAFITRAAFEVSNVWEFGLSPEPLRYVPPSETYQIALPVSGAPYTLIKDLSQAIEPNQIDRFVITVLGQDWKQIGKEFVFSVTVVLMYDGDKQIRSQPLFFSTRGDLGDNVSGYSRKIISDDAISREPDTTVRRIYQQLKENAEANQQAASEITKLNGKRSTRVMRILQRIVEGPRLVAPPDSRK